MSKLKHWTLAGLLAAFPAVAQDGAEQNNLWFMWEHIPQSDPLCVGAEECAPESQLRSHFMMNVPTQDAASLFQRLEPSAQYYGNANLTHDQLPICLDGPENGLIPPDIAALEYAEKIDTLRGLAGVHADLRGVRGPATFKGQFGVEAHNFLVEVLAEAGIPLLTKEQVETTPGRPVLGLRFSPEVHGCRPWSVSLSLKQDMLLSRDLTLMLSGTTWSASQSQSEADADFSPRDAMKNAILSFVEAWQLAHKPPEPEVAETEQKPASEGG